MLKKCWKNAENRNKSLKNSIKNAEICKKKKKKAIKKAVITTHAMNLKNEGTRFPTATGSVGRRHQPDDRRSQLGQNVRRYQRRHHGGRNAVPSLQRSLRPDAQDRLSGGQSQDERSAARTRRRPRRHLQRRIERLLPIRRSCHRK